MSVQWSDRLTLAGADLDARWADPARREQLLMTARLLETEPSVRGVSPHLLCVAERPAS